MLPKYFTEHYRIQVTSGEEAWKTIDFPPHGFDSLPFSGLDKNNPSPWSGWSNQYKAVTVVSCKVGWILIPSQPQRSCWEGRERWWEFGRPFVAGLKIASRLWPLLTSTHGPFKFPKQWWHHYQQHHHQILSIHIALPVSKKIHIHLIIMLSSLQYCCKGSIISLILQMWWLKESSSSRSSLRIPSMFKAEATFQPGTSWFIIQSLSNFYTNLQFYRS